MLYIKQGAKCWIAGKAVFLPTNSAEEPDIYTFMRRMVFLVCAYAVLACGIANGQSLALSFDFNTPSTDPPASWGQEPKEVSSGLAFGLSLHNRSFFASRAPLRFGIEVGHQKLTEGVPDFPGSNTSFSAFNVLGSLDRRIVDNSKFVLSAGMTMGLSFMTDSLPCNEPFCNLPESAILVTPRIRVARQVSRKVAFFFDTRWAAFLNDAESTYPYRSGFIFAVGIEQIGSSGRS